jgi:hypothetical protein
LILFRGVRVGIRVRGLWLGLGASTFSETVRYVLPTRGQEGNKRIKGQEKTREKKKEERRTRKDKEDKRRIRGEKEERKT